MFLGSSLESCPEINIHVANGKTPLHAAAQSGNENKLIALIEDVK
jgi:ankyrin repeat protein